MTKEPAKKKTKEEEELEQALDSDDDYGGVYQPNQEFEKELGLIGNLPN